jgi:hypothetical protein
MSKDSQQTFLRNESSGACLLFDNLPCEALGTCGAPQASLTISNAPGSNATKGKVKSGFESLAGFCQLFSNSERPYLGSIGPPLVRALVVT